MKLVTVKRSRFSHVRLDDPETWPLVAQFFFYPRPLGRQQFFGLRVVLLVAMIFFSAQLFRQGYDAPIAQYLHCLNLPVHETGHIVFGIFGKPVVTSLGGSLFQIIMPLVFGFALWIKPRDLMGASVGLWWAFENFIDVAPYIDDALHMRLMLISGGTGTEAPYGFHDWNFILSETGLLLKHDKIADVVYTMGYAGMVLCCLWAAWSLFYYFKYQRV
ncbi:hypothetical protein B7992_12060 [Fibrobacter sp. UWH1]|nr:hypothetical protein B7992_12060 [Fibrobacter sp. UWH1]